MSILILACALTLPVPLIGAPQSNPVEARRQTVIVDGIGYEMVQVRNTGIRFPRLIIQFFKSRDRRAAGLATCH